ncbi:MAG: hypothetical protein F6J93_07945 [Oscillatoria sp. SIO1A7]|nr:hypothetical protein [Oscillatoria sp. SIO1A7]
MGWIFSLSAECGSNREAAQRFAKHFDQIGLQLSSGVDSKCSAGLFQDSEDNWWARVCPNETSQVGITTPEDAAVMTELGLLLYKHLRLAPSFRYAMVGVEVDEFRTYSELLEPEERPDILWPGLVLERALWQLMDSPVGFRSFAPSYLWKPYEGEAYKPLMNSSALREKINSLLQTAN